MVLSNLTFTGSSPIDLSIGDNVTGVSFSGVSLGGTGFGLVNFVTAADTLIIADTNFAASLAGYIINSSPNTVLATGATFGTVGPADNTLADLYAVEDKIADAIDVSGFGLVRLRAGNVYVTPNSFFPLAGTTTPSIQRGIDAASSGDTVNVEAGTYSGDINIDKSLSLQGAEAGVDPGATGWGLLPVSKILGLGINAPIQIESGVNNVTISGFDIESPAGGSGALNAGIWMNGSSGITIEDNVLQNNTVGVAIADAGGSINNNLIQNNNAPGAGGGNGVEFFGGSSGVWSIAHNHFTGNSSADILIATGGPTVSNVTISNNTLTSSGGIDLFNTDGALVFENSASAMQGPAVYIGGDDSNIEVSQNDLSNNSGQAAVMLDNSFAVGTNSDISIHNNFLDTNAFGVDVTAGSLTGSMTVVDNHIQGNTTAGLENDSTATVNADFNWWGSATGPTNAANPGGSGDKIIDPTASFSPWLTSGVDAQDGRGDGFQPGPGTSVGITGPSSGTEGATYTLNLTPSSDITSWDINWGDGTMDMPDIEHVVGSPASVSHVYVEEGPYTISAVAHTSSGDVSSNTVNVSIADAALHAGALTPPVATEGHRSLTSSYSTSPMTTPTARPAITRRRSRGATARPRR